jgi:hypothetical protein
LPEALAEVALSRWEWSALTVQTLASVEEIPTAAVQEALRKTLAGLRMKAGLQEGKAGA